MMPPIVGYPCPLRARPVKHTVSGSCRPRERALDTPENRFVKAFIGQSRTIIGRMRSDLGSSQPDAFRRNVLRDCDRMEASLMPIARHSMWEEVERMVRIPFSSAVLQRRRGYRRVLQHFSRIRLAPMIPLDKDAMRDLLELKNFALLYEPWTFFRGRPAVPSRPISQPAGPSNGLQVCGEFRFGVPGSSVQSGNQAIFSPAELREELQGVGAIPVVPVVGDKTGGGRRGVAASDEPLRETLRRMLGGGGGMSTTPYI